MSQFLNDLEVRLYGWGEGAANWITLTPLRYESAFLGESVYIPDEFVTDFASVPRLPLAYLLAGGRAIRPAVIHDYAYQTHRLPLEKGGTRPLTREEADNIFREAMEATPGPAQDRGHKGSCGKWSAGLDARSGPGMAIAKTPSTRYGAGLAGRIWPDDTKQLRRNEKGLRERASL